MEVVGRHRRGIFLFLVFNFLIIEKQKFPKSQVFALGIEIKERSYETISVHCDRNTLIFSNGWFLLVDRETVVVIREPVEVGALLRFMLVGGHRHPTDLVHDPCFIPF